MTDREKIIEIIKSNEKAFFEEKVIKGNSIHDNEFAERLADALIADGIGDVSEWKERAKKHRVQILPDGAIKQLYSDEEVEQIAKDRDEWKKRAEVAEKEREEYRNSNRIVLRGLEIIKRNIIRYCHTDLSNILLQAAREIEEEERK